MGCGSDEGRVLAGVRAEHSKKARPGKIPVRAFQAAIREADVQHRVREI